MFENDRNKDGLSAPKRSITRASESSWGIAVAVTGILAVGGIFWINAQRPDDTEQSQAAMAESPPEPDAQDAELRADSGAVQAPLPDPAPTSSASLSALRSACVTEVRTGGGGKACREYEVRTRTEADPDITVLEMAPAQLPRQSTGDSRPQGYSASRDWMYAVEHYCDLLQYGSIRYRRCRNHDAVRWIKQRCAGFAEELETARGEANRGRLWADHEAACSAANRFRPVN